MKAFLRVMADLRNGLLLAAGLGLAVPGLATQGFAADLGPPGDQTNAGDGDPFAEWSSLGEGELAASSGGTALTIHGFGMNMATNNATLNGNSVEGNVNTGQISNNRLEDVGGINSLMFNTGNNVNFQSNMQVNIFLN